MIQIEQNLATLPVCMIDAELNEFEYLFTYGTLRKGKCNHFYLEGAEFIAEDIILGKLFTLESATALIPGNDTILGEVYKVPNWMFEMLDALEGTHYGLYQRSKVQTLLGYNSIVYVAGSLLLSGIN